MSDLTYEASCAAPAHRRPPRRASEVHAAFCELLTRAGIEPMSRQAQNVSGGITVFLLGAGLPLIEITRFIG